MTDRGQPREIAFFRFDGDGGPGEAAAPLPALSPGFVSNRPEYQPEPQRNVTAIVLDMINIAPPDQNGAHAAAALSQRAAFISSATTWPLNPAINAVRVIVRDRSTGRHGTLDMPIRGLQ